jgi:hypothetical protein
LVAELATVVPWDDGIPARFADHPQFSWHVPEQVRRVRAHVPLRLDEAGGLHLLGDGILHLDAGGAAQGRTPVTGPVADYACDAAGTCVLLADGRLRALDPAGTERWAIDGGFTKVLSAGDRVYAQAADGIAEIDGRSGSPRRTLPQRPGSGPAFLGGGRLVSVVYDEQRDLRSIVALDPDGEAAELTGTDELYPWLVYPFGTDGRARLYVWRDGHIARVSLDGEIDVLGALDGIAVRGDDVFTSRHEGDEVVVSGPDGETRLPAPAGFRLISVDSTGNFHLLGGEAPGDAGRLRVHAPDGRLQSAEPPPEDLAAIDCRVPVHTAWQVDTEGRVTIPVVTPAGVAVVRLRKR